MTIVIAVIAVLVFLHLLGGLHTHRRHRRVRAEPPLVLQPRPRLVRLDPPPRRVPHRPPPLTFAAPRPRRLARYRAPRPSRT